MTINEPELIVRTPAVPLQVPVHVRVGADPEVVIGWIEHPTALPGLLRGVADEIESINEKRIHGPGADR